MRTNRSFTDYTGLEGVRNAIFTGRTSAITSSRLLLARLPASAGIVTEIPKGRLFGGSLGLPVCLNHSALSS